MKIFFGLLIATFAIQVDLIAAEAGMPQLDPKYWASQGFWLLIVFSGLYLAMSKIFIPKIKGSLDDRDNKIKSDLDEAKKLKDISEKKQEEYLKTIEEAKKEVQKILFESKKRLKSEIQNKKKTFDNEIDLEIQKAEKEIVTLKQNSLRDVEKISEDIASRIIEEISGDKLNESSVRAAISETAKSKLGKYL